MKLGLIGNPIKHSLSPWIHNQLLQQANISGEYNLYELEPGSFTEQVELLRKEGLNGFNVTVPFKQKIMMELDDVDTQAELIGAVNTVKVENGQWTGFNTDGKGFLNSLKVKYPDISSSDINILILGAGGAAKGIFYTLVHAGFENIDIANRTSARVKEMTKGNDKTKRSGILSLAEAENHVADYDLIIQTTTVGMKPHTEQQIISLENIREGTIVSDIVYQPLMTAFLKEASEKGARIHQGHEMLLYQAVYAFEIWTGASLDEQGLLETLEAHLKGA
ncbi:shikimate dehydrogenase [Thalassobacillus devorans]|uniref:shikimate dehydrogenase n=1 Tax=Thalassobacillus devorans TaxID=279813 RepID=UPI00048E893F|nr:shikimate dehydrogenase [Thalassobacillus devorans]